MENIDSLKSMIFSKGKPLPAQLKKFTGQCYLEMLIPFESLLGCSIGNVTFERPNFTDHR
jgi:hypothetical protein